jgi:hypothetical protein
MGANVECGYDGFETISKKWTYDHKRGINYKWRPNIRNCTDYMYVINHNNLLN